MYLPVWERQTFTKDYNGINLNKLIFSVAFTGNIPNDFVTIIVYHQNIISNMALALV